MENGRSGARQPHRFDPARADMLDDPEREAWLPTYRIIELLDLPDNAQVLDLGSGTGRIAIALARYRPDAFIYAVEEQAEMLELMQRKLDERLTENVLPMLPPDALPLENRIDRLLAVNVLHELGDAALATVPLLLRETGIALIVDWNADVERPVGPPSAHIYGVAQAEARLRAVGLDPVRVGDFRYHYAFRCMLALPGARRGP